MIYIASPYSHPDPAVMDKRAEDVAAFAAERFRLGDLVYCPIAAWHWVAQSHELPKDWPAWRRMDYEILRHCSEIWVLELDGWQNSRGVSEELVLARMLGLKETHFEAGTHALLS